MKHYVNDENQLSKCQQQIRRLESANAFAKQVIAKQRKRFVVAVAVAVVATALFLVTKLGVM